MYMYESTNQCVDISILTDDELNSELEKGFSDIDAGRVEDAKNVFDETRGQYGISTKNKNN